MLHDTRGRRRNFPAAKQAAERKTTVTKTLDGASEDDLKRMLEMLEGLE